MQADNVSRVLLAAILLCVALLLIQHRVDEAASADAPPALESRFAVRAITLRRGPALLLRADTATGEAWTMGIMDAPRWKPLREGSDGVPAPGATAAGRFSINAIPQPRGAPTLVRQDGVTGRVWRKGSMSPGPWVPVPNPEEAAAEAPAAEEGGSGAEAPPTAAAEPDPALDPAPESEPESAPEATATP